MDNDGDGVVNGDDACPDGDAGWVSDASTDHDGDGCRDSEDLDDDNDGIMDDTDLCPKGVVGPSVEDYDSDGCRNSEDQDDDNDGLDDLSDTCPQGFIGLTADEDYNGDGCRDYSVNLFDVGSRNDVMFFENISSPLPASCMLTSVNNSVLLCTDPASLGRSTPTIHIIGNASDNWFDYILEAEEARVAARLHPVQCTNGDFNFIVDTAIVNQWLCGSTREFPFLIGLIQGESFPEGVEIDETNGKFSGRPQAVSNYETTMVNVSNYYTYKWIDVSFAITHSPPDIDDQNLDFIGQDSVQINSGQSVVTYWAIETGQTPKGVYFKDDTGEFYGEFKGAYETEELFRINATNSGGYQIVKVKITFSSDEPQVSPPLNDSNETPMWFVGAILGLIFAVIWVVRYTGSGKEIPAPPPQLPVVPVIISPNQPPQDLQSQFAQKMLYYLGKPGDKASDQHHYMNLGDSQLSTWVQQTSPTLRVPLEIAVATSYPTKWLTTKSQEQSEIDCQTHVSDFIAGVIGMGATVIQSFGAYPHRGKVSWENCCVVKADKTPMELIEMLHEIRAHMWTYCNLLDQEAVYVKIFNDGEFINPLKKMRVDEIKAMREEKDEPHRSIAINWEVKIGTKS
jgi:hypothetical protein